jgi:single-strand DNA-binding protein
MRSFCEITLVWHLTADPKWKVITSWNSVANFSVAVNKVYKSKDWQKKEEVNYHDVTLWGLNASNGLKLLKKWDYIMVKGHLKNSSWTPDDWIKRTKTEIIADSFYLLSSKRVDWDDSELVTDPELDFSELDEKIG